jgi:hypothetical protein
MMKRRLLQRGVLVRLQLIFSVTFITMCTQENNDADSQRWQRLVDEAPFHVSASNDSIVMKYAWEKRIDRYTIRIDRREESYLRPFDTVIDTLPALHPGDALVLTTREIREELWDSGFDLLFLHGDTTDAVYGWQYADGRIKMFVTNVK